MLHVFSKDATLMADGTSILFIEQQEKRSSYYHKPYKKLFITL
jgi:hypothetical protein